MIRKFIHWATATTLWPNLWDTRPSIFWYFYPTKEVATVEFNHKWVKEFLPRNEYKEHPIFGWRAEYDNKRLIQAVHFNSGVTIYFKAYAQDVSNIQTTTVHLCGADEEMPEEYFPEIRARLTSSRGYFMMVFTATIGQEIWRATLEDNGEDRPFPNSLRMTVSLFDCMHYEDGTPTRWTKARIQEEIDSCPNEREVQRRIYGKFVKAEGLAYASFDRNRNLLKEPSPVPKDWHIYAGVDPGSGGSGSGHPSAIAFIAVRPDFKYGRVFLTWRGDKILTTAGDTYNKFSEMRDERGLKCVVQVYDYACKDFQTIAARNNDHFIPADKARDKGNDLLNTLFQTGMLQIDDNLPNTKLVRELESLSIGTAKTKAVDDLIDAVRYPAMAIPWDYSAIRGVGEFRGPEAKKPLTEQELRRGMFEDDETSYNQLIEAEISEWNDFYEV